MEPKTLTLAKLARLSYRQPGTTNGGWASDLVEKLAEFGANGPQPFLGSSRGEGYAVNLGDSRVYVFRGTEFDFENDPVASVQDWVTNLRSVRLRQFSYDPAMSVGRGFGEVAETMLPQVMLDVRAAREANRRLWFVGHSLGGALATILAASVVYSGFEVRKLVTFGAPRVGGPQFAANVDKRLGLAGTIERYVNGLDIVPRVPLAWFGFQHGGTLRYFRCTNLRNATGDMVTNPSRYYVWLDQIYGRYLAWRQGIKHVAIRSHEMTRYETLVKATSSTKPRG